MGGACSTHGRKKRLIQGFGGKNLRARDDLEDPGVDGRILSSIFRKWDFGAWIGSSLLMIGQGGGHL
jgi:hypothetical protein